MFKTYFRIDLSSCFLAEDQEEDIKIAAEILYWKKMALTVSIVSVILQVSLGVSIFGMVLSSVFVIYDKR